jgi:AcrR family transcriptional regulator
MATQIQSNSSKKRSPEAIQERKKTILNEAIKEFAKEGFDGADLDRLAEAARVGKGTIYRYYESKEGLFRAMTDEVVSRLRDFVLSGLQREGLNSSLEQLKSAGKAFLGFFDRNRNLVEIFLQERSQFRGIAHSKYLKAYGENIQIFQTLVEACMAQGIIKRMDSRKLLDALGDMLVGLVYMWGVRQEKGRLAEKWTLVEQTVFDGILAK